MVAATEKSISAIVGTCGVRNYPLSGSHMMGATESGVGESACLSTRCARASCHLVARACAVIRIGPLAIVNYFFTQMCTSLAEELK